MDQDVVLKGEWPILQFQSGGVKHGTDSVGDRQMRTLCQANGAGGVGRSHFHFVTCLFKEVVDFRVSTELSTTVESDLAVRCVGFVVRDESG